MIRTLGVVAVGVSWGFMSCAAGGGGNPPAAAPAQVESVPFDPAVESTTQPFEVTNGLRGPGLHINGLRLESERGSFLAMVSGYESDDSIVLLMMPTEQTPGDWLDACRLPEDDPNQPPILSVQIDGAGDASHNVLFQGEAWTTSITAEQYESLDTLRVNLCGNEYTLAERYHPRLKQHQRRATAQALAAHKQEREGYRSSCDQGDTNACLRLASMQRSGTGGPADADGALALYQRLCEQDMDTGCLGVFRILIEAPSPQLDDGAKARYAKAAHAAARACELAGPAQAISCFQAARLNAAGFGVKTQAGKVEEQLQAACKKRFGAACKQRDAIVSCANGQGEACAQLAAITRASEGHKEVGERALWLRAACDRGHTASCQP